MITKEYPNRAGLLRIKEDINIATMGKDILQDKIESLIILFFDYIKQRGEGRKHSEELLSKAFRDLIILESLIGVFPTKSNAFSVPEGSLVTKEKKII